jgi:hypothetical protein
LTPSMMQLLANPDLSEAALRAERRATPARSRPPVRWRA